MKIRHLTVLIVSLGFVLTACDDGTVELSTTSSLITGTTETPATADPTPATDTTLEQGTTATSLVGETVGSYEVMKLISDDNGETLHILIPPGAYTEVDLENFIGDLKEADPELWGAEVFDDEQALQVFVISESERTEEQQTLIDEHHFVSLVNGDTIVYRGPFEEFGQAIIGS